MRLIIFDLDGTLTDTTQVDEHAIVGALQDVLGVQGLSTDWSDYEHSTDAGIVNEVITTSLGTVTPNLLQRVQDRFFEYIEGFYTSSPDLFRALPGASDIMKRMLDEGNAVAIATGSWRESALFKLRVAMVWHDGIPMATADDDVSRSSIIQKAIQEAKRNYGVENFSEIVYIGDGAWDARASTNVGISFIGVARNGAAMRLREHGANKVCEDLQEVATLLTPRP